MEFISNDAFRIFTFNSMQQSVSFLSTYPSSRNYHMEPKKIKSRQFF